MSNAVWPTLVKALPAHPKANIFRVSWVITTDPKRPLESLPHFLVYDRKAKTLAVHRDMPTFVQFLGVADTILQKLVVKNGNANDLLNASCIRQDLAEK